MLVSAQAPEFKRVGIAALGAKVEVARRDLRRGRGRGAPARGGRSGPGLRVGVRRRLRDRRQRRPPGARDPGAAPRRAVDRRAGGRRRAGRRHRRRGRPARDQAAGRLARIELRHAPLARRGARLHHLRRRADAGRGARGRGQRADLRDGARLLPGDRALSASSPSAAPSSTPTGRWEFFARPRLRRRSRRCSRTPAPSAAGGRWWW